MSLLLFSLKTQYLPLSSGLDGQQRGSDFRVLAWKQNQTCAKLTAASIIRERWRTKGCWLWLIHHHRPSSTLYTNSVVSPYPRKKDSHIQVGVTAITVEQVQPVEPDVYILYPASSTSIEITYQVIRLQCSHCKAISLFIQILRPEIIFKLLHLQII